MVLRDSGYITSRAAPGRAGSPFLRRVVRMNGAMVPVSAAEHVKMTLKSGKVPEERVALWRTGETSRFFAVPRAEGGGGGLDSASDWVRIWAHCDRRRW